jgi:hypothetical protein
VNSLRNIALRHNALILLVAHKKKDSFSDDVNDDVSGSADITNQTTIHISYERNKDIDEEQRLCRVVKNRLFGKVYKKGYVLNYDQKSKRIYGQGDDLYRDYGWDTGDGFRDVDEETPFDD